MDKSTEATAQAVPHDPVLDPENQHHHTHHHHTTYAEEGRQDEVVYSSDVQFEKGVVPEPKPLDHDSKSSSRDEEAAESYPQRTWYRRAMKHRRHAIHLVVWLLFTG
jgi:CNT family concentrative nucleoside transporter